MSGRWLVVRGGALGDFLLTTPALERVRAAADHVTLVAHPRYARLVPGTFDALIDVAGTDALWLHGAGPLPGRWDAALVYTPDVAARLRRAGVKEVREAPPRPPPGVSAVTHLLAPVADLPGPDRPAVPVPDAARARGRARLPAPGAVVLAPGAAGQAKRWPGFTALADALRADGVPVVWLPGRDEPPLPAASRPALPVLDLPAVAEVAAACGAWVGNDTGTTHLAAAAGAPTLALFGPTDPACWASPGVAVLPFDATPADVARRTTALRR